MLCVVKTLVSVIISVRNRSRFVREAVESVISQTYRPIEIIIVDDGTSQDVMTIVESFKLAHPNEVILHLRCQDTRSGVLRETGRAVSSGEFLQYLDSDHRLLPDKFAMQVNALQTNPDSEIAYGKTRLIDGRGGEVAHQYKSSSSNVSKLFPALLVDRIWCNHTPLYRRRLTDVIGAWSNLSQSEDWEYDARAGGMNVTLVNCRAFVSEHRLFDLEERVRAEDSLSPDQLRNQLVLDRALWINAIKSGHTEDSVEWDEFAQRVFVTSCRCGAVGLAKEARECLVLAEDAAGSNRRATRRFLIFELAAMILGWWVAGHMFLLLNQCVNHFCKPPSFLRSEMAQECHDFPADA